MSSATLLFACLLVRLHVTLAATCAPGYSYMLYTVSFTNTVAPPGWTMQGRRNDPAARGAAVDGPFYDVTYQPGGATLIVGSTGALDLGIVATDSWMPPRAPDDFPLIAEIDAVLDVGHAPFRDQPQAQFGWVFAGQGQDQYCPISGLYVAQSTAGKVRVSLRQSQKLEGPPKPPADSPWFAQTCPYIDDKGVWTSAYDSTGVPALPTQLTTEATNDGRFGFTWAAPKPSPVWHVSLGWEMNKVNFGIGKTAFTVFSSHSNHVWINPSGAAVNLMLGHGKNSRVTEGEAFTAPYTMIVSAVTINGCVTTLNALSTPAPAAPSSTPPPSARSSAPPPGNNQGAPQPVSSAAASSGIASSTAITRVETRTLTNSQATTSQESTAFTILTFDHTLHILATLALFCCIILL